MKDRTFIILVFILSLIIVLLYSDIKKEKGCIPEYTQLKINKHIDTFDLIDAEGRPIKSSSLRDNDILGIFILKQPCPSCDPNIYYFEKLSKAYSDKFTALGIILSDVETLHEFLSAKRPHFRVFRVVDIQGFKKAFNVNFNSSQATLLKSGTVIYSKSGNLNPEEFFKIKKIIKGGMK